MRRWSIQHHRARPHRHARHRRGGGGARRRAGHDPRNAPRMKPPPVIMATASGSGGQQSADHAGRPDPLERPAGRGGARRDAGTGRPRSVADLACLRRRRGGAVFRLRRSATRSRPRFVLGEAGRRSRSAMRRQRCAPRRPGRSAPYRTPRHNHNAIELHAVTVGWEDGR